MEELEFKFIVSKLSETGSTPSYFLIVPYELIDNKGIDPTKPVLVTVKNLIQSEEIKQA